MTIMKLLRRCGLPLMTAFTLALVSAAAHGQRITSRCAAAGGWYDYDRDRCLPQGSRGTDDFAHQYGAALGGLVIGATYASGLALWAAARRLEAAASARIPSPS
ncbi:MAG: hypothetical protein NVS4B3_08080 [Gemmatimonadaceae bacterium]